MTTTELHNLVAPVWERWPEARPRNGVFALELAPAFHGCPAIWSWACDGAISADVSDAVAEALIEHAIDRLLERLAGEGGCVRIDIPNDYLPKYGASIADPSGSNLGRTNADTRLAAKVALALAMGNSKEIDR